VTQIQIYFEIEWVLKCKTSLPEQTDSNGCWTCYSKVYIVTLVSSTTLLPFADLKLHHVALIFSSPFVCSLS